MELGLDEVIFLLEEFRFSLPAHFLQQAHWVLLSIAASKIEHFGCILIKQDTPVHLVDSHLLLLYLLAAKTELIFLFDHRKACAHIDGRMLAERDEAISGVLLVLLLLEGGQTHQLVELAHLVDLKLRYVLRLLKLKIFIPETAVHGGGSLCLLLEAGRTALEGVAEDGFDIHKN